MNLSSRDLFHRDRKTNTHNSLSAERRSDLESEQIEQISIEFKQFRYAPILLSCFYRSPDSTVSFFDSLANIVDLSAAENKEVHIVGDWTDFMKLGRQRIPTACFCHYFLRSKCTCVGRELAALKISQIQLYTRTTIFSLSFGETLLSNAWKISICF